MSAGGQRGIDVSGITSVRLQNPSDVLYKKKIDLVAFGYGSGSNAFVTRGSNLGNDSYIEFLKGVKDCSANCVGQTFTWDTRRSFR